MLLIRTGIYIMPSRIANRAENDQQSDLCIHCFSLPFVAATCVQKLLKVQGHNV